MSVTVSVMNQIDNIIKTYKNNPQKAMNKLNDLTDFYPTLNLQPKDRGVEVGKPIELITYWSKQSIYDKKMNNDGFLTQDNLILSTLSKFVKEHHGLSNKWCYFKLDYNHDIYSIHLIKNYEVSSVALDMEC